MEALVEVAAEARGTNIDGVIILTAITLAVHFLQNPRTGMEITSLSFLLHHRRCRRLRRTRPSQNPPTLSSPPPTNPTAPAKRRPPIKNCRLHRERKTRGNVHHRRQRPLSALEVVATRMGAARRVGGSKTLKCCWRGGRSGSLPSRCMRYGTLAGGSFVVAGTFL